MDRDPACGDPHRRRPPPARCCSGAGLRIGSLPARGGGNLGIRDGTTKSDCRKGVWGFEPPPRALTAAGRCADPPWPCSWLNACEQLREEIEALSSTSRSGRPWSDAERRAAWVPRREAARSSARGGDRALRHRRTGRWRSPCSRSFRGARQRGVGIRAGPRRRSGPRRGAAHFHRGAGIMALGAATLGRRANAERRLGRGRGQAGHARARSALRRGLPGRDTAVVAEERRAALGRLIRRPIGRLEPLFGRAAGPRLLPVHR